MIYISIGTACNVKYQIDRFFGKKQTLFFDWLMTDMDSVINILNYYNNINELLFYDNIIRDPSQPIAGIYSQIIIKSLSFCVSIHDIDKNITKDKINDFINKYIRRFNRIIDYIKQSNKIYFIRYGEVINNIQKINFINIIKKINSNCNFTLVSLIENNSINNIIENDNNYICININRYIISNGINDWHTNNLNWKKIFDDMKYNTNTNTNTNTNINTNTNTNIDTNTNPNPFHDL